ncbi:glycosyltransferase family 4 protein [Clostridium scatologenes]|uniref:Group 1 glycosyl transferase n=1 Tax=Clostridium scatologenes TaxID=1548 RepID=A0A0E3M647_CLOSL|nr:glycosyltransferase family 1 protein [Clostridium scatologenes]AKA67157.1 group 1 glycosyl transferase [Clostridium scatologenes]
MKIGIDLLWVKPQKSGGVEAYIRNLLDGFFEIKDKNEFVLITARDNHMTFNKYLEDSRFKKVICNICSSKVVKRLLWQNLRLNSVLKKNEIGICFEPIYSKPIINFCNKKFITTIHDLQALHYPEYFSVLKYLWLRFCWRKTIKSSVKIIAISNFVKDDIILKYHANPDKIQVIYNPIVIDKNICSFDKVSKKFNIEENNYYYTVAQLLPHKNLETLVEVIKKLKEKGISLPNKLLVSGVNGKSQGALISMIEKYNLKKNVILTGYIDNDERNILYKNCKAFLYSSVFEGFGMPPIEAMILGAKVISTNRTSIYEVTQGKALYVEDPYNVDEWIERIRHISELESNKLDFHIYNKKNIAEQYLKVFYDVM